MTLASCVCISHLYIVTDQKPENPLCAQIYQSALTKEISRLAGQLDTTVTQQDLLSNLSAQIFYSLLGIAKTDMTVDLGTLERTGRTALRLHKLDGYAAFNTDRLDDPNETWEEFIYAESRRRYNESIHNHL